MADNVDALGHTAETVYGKAPTCTENGLTDGSKCSVCTDILTEQTEIAATGHNYEAVVTDPTCEADGFTTYTCFCGDTYTAEETEAIDHSWLDATVEAPKTCERCGATEGEKLPEPIQNAEPTITKDHEKCEASGIFDRIFTAIRNFFRMLVGLPKNCYCGDEL